MSNHSLLMIDNTGLKGREEKYQTVCVDLEKILVSWQISVFSFEWLLPSGEIRRPAALPEKEREKYFSVLNDYESGQELERPILGIGVLDNVEIGSRRDVLLTLKTQGIEKLSVHIPRANYKDFEPFIIE